MKFMKTAKILLGMATVAAMGLVSCDEAGKLAGQVEGTWKGATTEMLGDKHHKGHNMPQQPVMSMMCTPVFAFSRTDGTKGGTLDIQADYVLTQGLLATSDIQGPFSATVKGTATARGTWTAKDDDEIMVVMDPSMIKVEVDTASLALNYTALTDRPASDLAAIKARVAGNVESQVRTVITNRVMKLRELDDVEVHGQSMTLEIGHAKMAFTKES